MALVRFNTLLSTLDADDWILAATTALFGKAAHLLGWNGACLGRLDVIVRDDCGHSAHVTHGHAAIWSHHHLGATVNLQAHLCIKLSWYF